MRRTLSSCGDQRERNMKSIGIPQLLVLTGQPCLPGGPVTPR
jgi:hypothetical protein